MFNECAMEYATSVKGNARQRLLEAAQKIRKFLVLKCVPLVVGSACRSCLCNAMT